MQCQNYSVVPDLDFLGVLGDVTVNGFFNLIAFAASDSEDQVVEGGATEDINVVTYELTVSVRSDHIIGVEKLTSVGATTRRETIGLVRHLISRNLDA